MKSVEKTSYFGKILRAGSGFLFFLKNKIRFGSKINLSVFNSIDGKIRIRVDGPSKIVIGRDFMARGPVYLDTLNRGEITIGKKVFFNHNCAVTSMESITIGDGCMFGNNLVIVDHNHKIKNGDNEYECKPIRIGNKVWIGANCTILPGTIIEDNAIIGANSVVKGCVGKGEMWGGIKARIIKTEGN